MKVEIRAGSAILEGIGGEQIHWEMDPDSGYLRASEIDGVKDLELLAPAKLYSRQGRSDGYRAHVDRLINERREYLDSWGSLRAGIAAGL